MLAVVARRVSVVSAPILPVFAIKRALFTLLVPAQAAK